MKRLFLLITACMLVMTAYAQSAMIRLSYEHWWIFGGTENVHKYMLHTSADNSMFYNPTAYQMDMCAKDETARQAYGTMAAAMQASGRGAEVPNRSVSMYIAKSLTDGTKTVYDDFYDVFAWYDEPFDEMNWHIVSDSTRTVLDYECIMAESDYHGRHWKAWFAPEIPIQDGPWKLAGLPGLILSADESSGQHSFTATYISTSDRPITPNIGAGHYETTDRISMLKALRRFEDNPIAGLSASLGVKITVKDDIEFDKSIDFLETDYR